MGMPYSERNSLARDATSSIEVGHRQGEKSSPDSGDLLGYVHRVQPVPGRDGAMTDVSAAVGSGRAPSTARPGLIDRHDLVAALDGHCRRMRRLPGDQLTVIRSRGAR
jgi:hypothetical protein